MNVVVRAILFVVFSGALVFATSRLETGKEYKQLPISIVHGQEKIVITNNGAREAELNLNINHKIFQNLGEIVSAINDMPDEFKGEPAQRKAWRYVANNTEQLKVHSDNVWIHNPVLMLNSLGFGLCDDLATALSFIWKKQGFKSRVWGLGGHVVPEVFAQGKWQMYDPTFGVYYLNNKKEVADVEELAKTPELIFTPNYKLPINYNRAFIVEARKYSEDIASLYSSAHDNAVNDSYSELKAISDFRIHLPAGASMEFPATTPDSLFVPYLLGKLHLECFVKITLPQNFAGKINFPFMVCQIKGKGRIKVNDEEFDLEENKLNSSLSRFEDYKHEIDFEEPKQPIDVYCLLNPFLFNQNGSDTVSITGKNLGAINIVAQKQTQKHSYFFTEQKVSALAWKYYNLVMSKKDTLTLPFFDVNRTDVSPEVVSNTIRLLVSKMDGLTAEEKDKQANALVKKWEVVYPKLKEVKLKKKFSFNSDPAYFALFLGYLESNAE